MGFFDELGKEVVSRVVNRTGERKFLYCRRCAEFTRHISISHARYRDDLQRSRPEKIFTWFAGKLNDLSRGNRAPPAKYACARFGVRICAQHFSRA